MHTCKHCVTSLCYNPCIHANMFAMHRCLPLIFVTPVEINVTRPFRQCSQRPTCFLHRMFQLTIHTLYTYIHTHIYIYIYSYIYIYIHLLYIYYTFHTTIAVDAYGRHYVLTIVGRRDPPCLLPHIPCTFCLTIMQIITRNITLYPDTEYQLYMQYYSVSWYWRQDLSSCLPYPPCIHSIPSYIPVAYYHLHPFQATSP